MVLMRRLKWAMLVIEIGEIVTMATTALAQSPSYGQPAASRAISAQADSAGNVATNGSDSKSISPVQAADSTTTKQSTAAKAGGTGAGYSWRGKSPRDKHRAAHKMIVDPHLTQAKGPEFQVVSDGSSRISVLLSRRVEVLVHGTRRRYIYDLPNVQVAVANDLNPLITTHFSTPLQDVRLVSHQKGARLVVDLRESVAPQYSMKDIAGGGSQLEVVLPKSSRKNIVAADMRQQERPAKTRPRKKQHESKDQPAALQNGIGPRL